MNSRGHGGMYEGDNAQRMFTFLVHQPQVPMFSGKLGVECVLHAVCTHSDAVACDVLFDSTVMFPGSQHLIQQANYPMAMQAGFSAA